MGIAYNKKAPQKRGLVMLVGRARFELATNGLKALFRRRQAQFNTELHHLRLINFPLYKKFPPHHRCSR